MKKPFNWFVSLISVLGVIGLFVATQAHWPEESAAIIPRKTLFGNPEKTNPKLSPDAKWIAYLAPDGNDILNVYVAPTNDLAKASRITSDTKRGVRSYFWQFDGSAIVYLQDVDGNEDWHLLQTNINTKLTRDLTPFGGVRADVLAYEPARPNEILVSMNLRDRSYFDVHRINLDTGAVVLDTQNPGDIHDWVADNNLQIRASQAFSPDGGIVIRVRDTINSPWRDLIKWGPEEGLGGATAFTPNNKGLYILTSLGNNTVRLVSLDLVSGAMISLASDPTYDVEGLMRHPTTHLPQVVSVERERYGWIVLDDSLKSDVKAIEKFAGPSFGISSRSLDDQTWIIAARSDAAPTKYYLYHRPDKKSQFLFTTMPELAKYKLVGKKPIEYKARDGMNIHGYLSVPSNKPAKNLPVIIYVHGGPWTRDSGDFQPPMQWLANRGYGVLQINFRGSTGYGKEFVNAGNKEWGAKMHDDILDGKKWLVDNGIADPKKIAIFGGSYGGYATLAGLAFTPEEFCCGIDVVGPSNLITLLQTIPPYWSAGRALFDSRVGSLNEEPEFLKERSPLFKAHHITRPLLIAQGANDPRVKKSESDQIVAAMREHQKPVEYLVFEDEGHGFQRPENKKRFYAAVEYFLAEHLGGDKESPASDEEWEIHRR